MHKIIGSLTALLFFIWILPLGVFIKPSQEKKICGGQRAICMCSHMMTKQTAPAPSQPPLETIEEKRSEARSMTSTRRSIQDAGKTILKVGSDTQNSVKGSSSASQDFLLETGEDLLSRKITLYFQQRSIFHSFLFVRTIDHVPRT